MKRILTIVAVLVSLTSCLKPTDYSVADPFDGHTYECDKYPTIQITFDTPTTCTVRRMPLAQTDDINQVAVTEQWKWSRDANNNITFKGPNNNSLGTVIMHYNLNIKSAKFTTYLSVVCSRTNYFVNVDVGDETLAFHRVIKK